MCILHRPARSNPTQCAPLLAAPTSRTTRPRGVSIVRRGPESNVDSVHQAHGGVAAAPNFSNFSLLARLVSLFSLFSVSVRPPGQVNSQHHALRAASSTFVPTSRPIFLPFIVCLHTRCRHTSLVRRYNLISTHRPVGDTTVVYIAVADAPHVEYITILVARSPQISLSLCLLCRYGPRLHAIPGTRLVCLCHADSARCAPALPQSRPASKSYRQYPGQ